MRQPQRGSGDAAPRGLSPDAPLPGTAKTRGYRRLLPSLSPRLLSPSQALRIQFPFNLPACQLFQPSHYFYGSSLSSCQFIGVGFSRAGWDGAGSSPSCASFNAVLHPASAAASSPNIFSLQFFSQLKPFPCIFNPSLSVGPTSLLVVCSQR